jgi:adenosylcobyric acid synthase
MTAKTLMIQGTMSSVGKSVLVTGLCRLFARRGLKVAPFKGQNMSNNAAVCSDGGEIGRAQYTQALAAGVEPTVQMNPILLKPEGEMRSQVIVNGRVWQTLPARNYYERKQFLWEHVTAAFDSLSDGYDLLLMEGAGSPVELNLKGGDIVNMALAKYAQSPILLVGDIDRGGIFAQLLGTLMLLELDERALIKGLLVNKFRGDMSLFRDGIAILEQRGEVPVLGVIPYVHDLALPEEDAVAITSHKRSSAAGTFVDIAVIALPHIANFDDFDPLIAEAGVTVRYVSQANALGTPTAVILPGTKNTVSDLRWLRDSELAVGIIALAAKGVEIVGICGGYQMLGQRISDPQGVESELHEILGLGLLPGETIFVEHKATYQATATITSDRHWLARLVGQTVSGYEIHMGRTQAESPWLDIQRHNTPAAPVIDGAMSADGHVWGCYLHGLFANDNLRRAWLSWIGWCDDTSSPRTLESAFDRLADVIEANINMDQLLQIIGL